MMRKLFLILFSFGAFLSGIYGQKTAAYKSKWQTRALVGTTIPVTKLLQGTEADYLLQYDDHSYYWQIPSITCFFHKHWGLEFNFQAGTSRGIKNRADHFMERMHSDYSDKYYVRPETGASSSDLTLFYGDITRGYLGIVYRWETDKFYVYPKLSVGGISFSTDWGHAGLKEKNSNNEYNLSFSTKAASDFYFTLAPSVSFGYKIFNWFYFNADITLSYYKTDILLEKKFTNLVTRKGSVEYMDYKTEVVTLSLGAGLILVMR